MIRIRPYRKSDGTAFLSLVRALAAYEKLKPPTAAAARRMLGDVGRRIRVLMAELDGRAVGYAVYFFTYSTFLARPTLYLEDVFVLPEARGKGAGKAFFRELRRAAARERCGRMEWAVLRWNKPAIRFYDGLGAEPLGGWLTYRLRLRES
jgi:GNAT superfamily N-acetyltransferase